jgi:hypothetical protein
MRHFVTQMGMLSGPTPLQLSWRCCGAPRLRRATTAPTPTPASATPRCYRLAFSIPFFSLCAWQPPLPDTQLAATLQDQCREDAARLLQATRDQLEAALLQCDDYQQQMAGALDDATRAALGQRVAEDELAALRAELAATSQRSTGTHADLQAAASRSRFVPRPLPW